MATCSQCGDEAELEVNEPAFVSDAAFQNMRDQGYVGYSYGPLGRYPGAKGPAPPVPVWGSYGAQSRFALDGENGAPISHRYGIQSIATRQQGFRPNPPLPSYYGARHAIGESQGFYRREVSLANTIGIQTEDFPGGEVGYNLSVGNLPDGADGNLSAPVTYQQVTPPGGVGPRTRSNAPRPPLGMGHGGYRANLAEASMTDARGNVITFRSDEGSAAPPPGTPTMTFASATPSTPPPWWRPMGGQGGGGYRGQGRASMPFPRGSGAAIGPTFPVQSVATAEAAQSARQADEEAYRARQADEEAYRARQADEEAYRARAGFPWWKPTTSRGPSGSLLMARGATLDDSGGGYVSPTAYWIGPDGRYSTDAQSSMARFSRLRRGYAPGEIPGVPGYPTFYRDLTSRNTIDIQTQDYVGGEVGYNLSVGNLPDGADGTLSAPVVDRQLALSGGVAMPDTSAARPLLDWS